jgi:hypothetical protein
MYICTYVKTAMKPQCPALRGFTKREAGIPQNPGSSQRHWMIPWYLQAVFPVAKYFPQLLVKNKLKELSRGAGAIKNLKSLPVSKFRPILRASRAN